MINANDNTNDYKDCVNYIFLLDMDFEELMALFLIDIKNDSEYYDNIAIQLVKNYLSDFKNMIYLLKPERLASVIFSIGYLRLENSADFLVPFLENNDSFVVARTIDALKSTSDIDWSQIERFLKHDSEWVRGAALRFAKARLGKGAKTILFNSLKDRSPVVQSNALDQIDELDDILNEEELSRIKTFCDDSDTNVRQTAQTVYEHYLSRLEDEE